MTDRLRTYAMLAKPVSDTCNLRCEYCYYTGKGQLLNTGASGMTEVMLEEFTRQNLAMHGREAIVEFAWHGGEPLAAGLEFYREAVRLQRKYGEGRKILNTMQTNATLLTDELCRFFKANGFLLGVSIDGPEVLHDVYRRTPLGGGSFSETMRGIELLMEYGVPFNTLTTVNRANMDSPVEVYEFLRELTGYMQFLPVVERMPARYESDDGQLFAMPPGINSLNMKHPVTAFSVTPEGYGNFLCAVYDEWRMLDKGDKHVQIFDAVMGNIKGIPSALCVHNPLCGHSGLVESNGDVFACDRYAFPNYKLGNIMETSLGELMERNRKFGMHKTYGLSEECFDCSYIRLCFGGCPKDRHPGGRNYLCEGYKMFFEKIIKDGIS